MLWQRCVLWRRRTGNNEQTSAAAADDDDDDDDDEPVRVSICHYLYLLKALTSGVFSMSKHAQK